MYCYIFLKYFFSCSERKFRIAKSQKQINVCVHYLDCVTNMCVFIIRADAAPRMCLSLSGCKQKVRICMYVLTYVQIIYVIFIRTFSPPLLFSSSLHALFLMCSPLCFCCSFSCYLVWFWYKYEIIIFIKFIYNPAIRLDQFICFFFFFNFRMISIYLSKYVHMYILMWIYVYRIYIHM